MFPFVPSESMRKRVSPCIYTPLMVGKPLFMRLFQGWFQKRGGI
nr:MAG TPA: hypothetical protein [Caudoviricetes sp.]